MTRDDLAPYQRRLLKDVEESLNEAQRLLRIEDFDAKSDFNQRLSSVRSQLAQAEWSASELYGSMNQEMYRGR